MSKMTKKLTFVLAALFSILIVGAALSGCDTGSPPPTNNTATL